MLKKIGVAMLCIVMLFSFSACGNLTDLQSKITDLETKIEGLESDNATLTEKVDSLEKENKDLIDTINELEEVIDGYENSLLKVDVFIYDFIDNFMQKFMTEIEIMLGSTTELSFYDGEYWRGPDRKNTQKWQVMEAIVEGSDLFIIVLNDPDDDEYCSDIINLTKNADIPVIFFNRELSNDVLNTYDKAAFVGTSAAELGYTQGQMVAEYLLKPENINIDGSSKFADEYDNINYIMIKGDESYKEAHYRTLYSVVNAQRLLTAAGKSWTLVASDLNTTSSFDYSTLVNEFGEPYTADEIEILSKAIFGEWGFYEAKGRFETAIWGSNLNDKTKIGIIIASNDDAALGVLEALNDRSYNTGSENFIPVFSIDGTVPDLLIAISEGKIQGVITYDMEAQVAVIAHLALNLIAKKDIMAGTAMYNVSKFAKKIYVPYNIILGET